MAVPRSGLSGLSQPLAHRAVRGPVLDRIVALNYFIRYMSGMHCAPLCFVSRPERADTVTYGARASWCVSTAVTPFYDARHVMLATSSDKLSARAPGQRVRTGISACAAPRLVRAAPSAASPPPSMRTLSLQLSRICSDAHRRDEQLMCFVRLRWPLREVEQNGRSRSVHYLPASRCVRRSLFGRACR